MNLSNEVRADNFIILKTETSQFWRVAFVVNFPKIAEIAKDYCSVLSEAYVRV